METSDTDTAQPSRTVDTAATMQEFDAALAAMPTIPLPTWKRAIPHRTFVHARDNGTGVIYSISDRPLVVNARFDQRALPNVGVRVSSRVKHTEFHTLDISYPKTPFLRTIVKSEAEFSYDIRDPAPDVFVRDYWDSGDRAIVVALKEIEDPERIRQCCVDFFGADRIDPASVPKRVPVDDYNNVLVTQVLKPCSFEVHRVPQDWPQYVEWRVYVKQPKVKVVRGPNRRKSMFGPKPTPDKKAKV